MTNLLLELINRSIAAGWVILAVIILRMLLRRAPRWTVCLLWALVAVRLVCPFSLESMFSLIPSRETVRQDPARLETPYIDSGVKALDDAVNPVLHSSFVPGEEMGAAADTGVDTVQRLLSAAAVIWAVGAGAMLAYALTGYGLLRLKLRTAVRLETGSEGDPETGEGLATVSGTQARGVAGLEQKARGSAGCGSKAWRSAKPEAMTAAGGSGAWAEACGRGVVYVSEFVDTPFIFGILRPRIYLPSGMGEEVQEPVVAHELAHLKRRDNLWKVLAFGILSVYWFQPLCWAAYVLFGRDMELACDEKVIRGYDARQKKMYSEALLACSLDRRTAMVCPLAFGEVGVKERIKSVLHYKKPAFWAILAAVAACIVAALCFLTDPVDGRDVSDNGLSADNGGEMSDAGDGPEISDGSGTHSDSRGPSGSDDGSDETPDSQEAGSAAQEERLAAQREELVKAWAKAFVERDGDRIASMVPPELVSDFVSGPEGQREFGVSSPWPRDPQQDIAIQNIGQENAQIRYYAWTSDPHVTAWLETISYELREGKYVVTSSELSYLDHISTCEAYGQAYGWPSIDGTPMDYEGNGAGESLNTNALITSSMRFLGLFEPESAATELLNLSEDPSLVQIERLYEDVGEVNLEITFLEDENGLPMYVTMAQPYGSEGIWIPKDYRVNVISRFLNVDFDKIKNLRLVDGPGAWEDVICIAEIPEEKIRLYGYNDAEVRGQGVTIEFGEDWNFFDWIYTTTRCIMPECYWNGTDRQLQVALNVYTGTGAAAQELHVLQYHDTGTLTDNALEINDYEDMLFERIHFRFEEETGLLTLFDADNGKDLASVTVEDGVVEGLELGWISRFLLGDQIVLQLDPGYFVEDGVIAEYPEDMPKLEADLILGYKGGGEEITFSLGEIRVSASEEGAQ